MRSDIGPVQVAQLVPVEPQKEYEFEGYLSPDDLVSGSTPVIDIVDAVEQKTIASSPAAPRGTSKWNPVNLTFKTGENVEAVVVRVIRTSCVSKETPVCPIFGSAWYDNFSIKRRN